MLNRSSTPQVVVGILAVCNIYFYFINNSAPDAKCEDDNGQLDLLFSRLRASGSKFITWFVKQTPPRKCSSE